jgi:hypothetical protein
MDELAGGLKAMKQFLKRQHSLSTLVMKNIP